MVLASMRVTPTEAVKRLVVMSSERGVSGLGIE
jgi:hypothetical protein